MKKEKIAGDNYLDIFMGEYVELTVNLNVSAGSQFIIRGVLLGSDANNYYLGDTKAGVSVAVKKRSVIVTCIHDPAEELKEQFKAIAKPSNDEEIN